MSTTSPQPKLIVLFDMPRARSHLFFRFLGTHPDIKSVWHPFMPACIFGPERITLHTTEKTNVDRGLVVYPESDGDISYSGVTRKFVHDVEEAEDQVGTSGQALHPNH